MKKVFNFIFILNVFVVMLTCSSYAKSKIEVPENIRAKLADGKIIEMPLDEYLYGVVNTEMGTSYKTEGKIKQVGIEALKAQAIASRSYAVDSILNSKYDGYDIEISKSGQLYQEGEVKDIVKKAVDSTSGQVLVYDGKVVRAFFFTISGGHTESSENIWYSKLSYARGVEDPYEPYIDGKSEWTARFDANKYGKMEILERSENDRVIKLKIGNEVYEKDAIRSKLGYSTVKSNWFNLEYDEDTDEYVLSGKGYGHGVGMSQYGAIGMADAGFDYKKILKWYYTDIEIYPDKAEYIVIDEEENEDEKESVENIEEQILNESKKEEITKENDEIKKEGKSYSYLNPKVVNINANNVSEVKKGPLLQKILDMIKSWR